MLMRILLMIISLNASLAGQMLLSGRIVDAETNNPLEGVNVFLSRTTIGGTTDKNGFYTIRKIPSGQYELIVSMIGYSVVREEFQVRSQKMIIRDFRLSPEAIQMATIDVTTKSNPEWLKNYKQFKTAFLGTSENAKQCKIINEYMIQFERNEDELKAYAREPIIIENEALGYRLSYTLKDFIETGAGLRYTGYPFYQELTPKSKREFRRWTKKRKKAYLGSTRHFLKTISERYEENNKRKPVIIGDHYLPVLAEQLKRKTRKIKFQDKLVQEGFVVSIPRITQIKNDYKQVDPDQYLSPAGYEGELLLSYEGTVRIDFLDEQPEKYYVWELTGNYNTVVKWQVSFIKLGKSNVAIDKLGRYYEPYMLELSGYMAWERLADKLPFDYIPHED